MLFYFYHQSSDVGNNISKVEVNDIDVIAESKDNGRKYGHGVKRGWQIRYLVF